MIDIGAEIRKRRERLGWSGVKLATLAGIAPAFLSRVERGKSYYSQGTLIKIAGALGISVDEFYTGATKSNVEGAHLGWRRIPVLDYSQAGQWTSVAGNPEENEKRETIMTDLEHPPSTFALRIRGDSMEPKFREGDVVVIDPTIQPQPGDYVVATNDGHETTFRRFRSAGINEHGSTVFELLPLNSVYGVMRSDRQPLGVVGVMVEHRQYRRR
jgi:SOS-response transcriptional repressor LexA